MMICNSGLLFWATLYIPCHKQYVFYTLIISVMTSLNVDQTGDRYTAH